jgi:hypothetical protein
MALERTYNLGGGNLVVRPDPFKARLAAAQAAREEQAPLQEQQRIDIERANAQRALQALEAQTAQGRAQLGEEARYHTATLAETTKTREAQIANEQAKQAEELRYHTGTLGESAADRAARMTQAAKSERSAQLGDLIRTLGPTMGPGGVAKLMAAYGSPELAQTEAATQAEARRARATGLVTGLKTEADVSKAIGGLAPDPLTGKPNPADVNEAWNVWKAQRGDKAAQAALNAPTPTPTPGVTPTAGVTPTGGVAPDAAALVAAANGGTPTEGVGWRSTPLSVTGTPTSVKTEDRGFVKPSMGEVTATGGVAPIPGATPGRYGEENPMTAVAPPAATPGPTVGQRFAALMTTPTPTTAATPTAVVNPNAPPPTVDVDRLAQAIVGGPSMEELERRRRSAQPVGPTPYRTNQY